jgi:hypothetical protein
MIYVVFFLLLGGVLGKYLLRSHVWRWSALRSAIARKPVKIHARFRQIVGIKSKQSIFRGVTVDPDKSREPFALGNALRAFRYVGWPETALCEDVDRGD